MFKLLTPLLISHYFLMGVCAGVSQAQIIPDGSVNTQVRSSDQSNFAINGGQKIGNNLFHSFTNFSVPNNGTAIFRNSIGTTNIINRVTGLNASNIAGTIRAQGNANFFLINPNGIIFGPNSRLDIGGSFLASTAESFTFPDGQLFSSLDRQSPSLLSINIPLGLQFGANPAPIEGRGTFVSVPKGQNITLAGGEVQLASSSLLAPSGRVELVALGSRGELKFRADSSLALPNNITKANIELTQSVITVASDGGGSIKIDARNLDIVDQSILTAGIAEDEGELGAQAGDIEISASNVTIQRSSTVRNQVGDSQLSDINPLTQAIGDGGKINLDTNTITLRDGGEIRADTTGSGNAGLVTIRARDSFLAEGRIERPKGDPPEEFAFRQSGVFTNVNPKGNGNTSGFVLETGELVLGSGSFLNANAFGPGRAGKIRIKARDSILLKGQNSDISSNVNLSFIPDESVFASTGGIEIETGSLIAREAGKIESSVRTSNKEFGLLAGRGSSGLVKIKAQDSIVLDGESPQESPSTIFSIIQGGTTGTNNAGIDIETGSLLLRNGGRITSETRGVGDAGNVSIKARDFIRLKGFGSRIVGVSAILSRVDKEASGNAGDINIETGSFRATEGGQVSTSTLGLGDAGQVKIVAADSVTFAGKNVDVQNFGNENGGTFSNVTETSQGNAGGIQIEAADLSVQDGAHISVATANNGFAGDIDLKVANAITLSGDDTGIFASTAENSNSRGGNITIDPITVTIQEGAEISVSSSGREAAGQIDLTTDFLNLDAGKISATTTSNQGGDVTLNIGRLLVLSNDSSISAQASNNAAGGNILIDASNGIVLGTEASIEGNDITASAVEGSGGNITINALGLFGFSERKALLSNNTNDVDASSNFGVNGTIIFQTPETEPSDSIAELPEGIVIPATFSQRCRPGQALGNNEFSHVGPGGIPAPPTSLRSYPAVWHDIRSLSDLELATKRSSKLSLGEGEIASQNKTSGIHEARGWIKTSTGVKLVSSRHETVALKASISSLC